MPHKYSTKVGRQFTIQQALKEVSNNTVEVSEVAASIGAGDEAVLEEPY